MSAKRGRKPKAPPAGRRRAAPLATNGLKGPNKPAHGQRPWKGFSFVIMATVGSGDIDPTSRRAQLVVMCQILTGLIDAVVVFSIALDSTRQRESS